MASTIARTVGGGDVNCQNENVALDNSNSYSSCILIGQLKRKSEQMSKINQKLCPVATLNSRALFAERVMHCSIMLFKSNIYMYSVTRYKFIVITGTPLYKLHYSSSRDS